MLVDVYKRQFLSIQLVVGYQVVDVLLVAPYQAFFQHPAYLADLVEITSPDAVSYTHLLEAVSAYKLLPPKLEMLSGLMITYYTDIRSQLLAPRVDAVSYTHLDVYKRQRLHIPGGLLEVLQVFGVVVYEDELVIDVVTRQQHAHRGGKT